MSGLRLHLLLAAGCLLAIAVHLALRYGGASEAADYPLFIMLALGSLPPLREIVRQIVRGDFGADILAAMALIAALVLGEYLAAVLILLMLAGGQALEEYALGRASSVLAALAARMPQAAHRKVDGHTEDIAVTEIRIGDAIAVFPHEICPVDGVVIEGHGGMDESYLTGEPYHVSKAVGANVLSGAVNGESLLVIRAQKLPQDSRYAEITRVMREAEEARPRLRRLGDQLGAVFAPLALSLAILAWLATGDAERFLAVLVVATPCPLLIAVPITIISAISLAARRGIVIRDPTVLERLPTCRTAIFDKTGTLTLGRPDLTELLPGPSWKAEDVLRLAASLERYSRHPLAGAILRAAQQRRLLVPAAGRIAEKPGQGLSGSVEGREVAITSRAKFLAQFPGQTESLPPLAVGLECVVVADGVYAGTLRFRDTLRADGENFIGHLGPAHQFSKVMLVSGDRESEVAYLAQRLGIKEVYASRTPEQKLQIVREEAKKAPTLYMGDGINDAPALAAATVGLAFGEGSGVTSEAAGAVILENTLTKVDELLHLSQSMRSTALQSALAGMTLSLIGMGFAAAGYLSPVAGALLQEAIDVVAILWALRLTWRKRVNTDMLSGQG